MLLNISHTTKYTYDTQVAYGLQELRLMPNSSRAQEIKEWEITIEGGKKEAVFRDQNNNEVWLVSMSGAHKEITVISKGLVETINTNGVHGPHRGFAPLWYFQRVTHLTATGPNLEALVGEVRVEGMDPLLQLHALSAAILEKVAYETGMTTPDYSAEEALLKRKGVCQDHSHIFLAAARLLGFPSRYVSGYLMLDERVHQEASHAWAESYVEGLGWVGFDVSNGISPDERYVRLASGLDYSDAAPISGLSFGDNGKEMLVVDIQVAQ